MSESRKGPEKSRGFISEAGRIAKKYAHAAGFIATVGASGPACEQDETCEPDTTPRIEEIKKNIDFEEEEAKVLASSSHEPAKVLASSSHEPAKVLASSSHDAEIEKEFSKETSESVPFFDTNPEYFRHIPGGEFDEQERTERMETLPNGEKVFRDIGLTFYHVKSGDGIDAIRSSLSQYDEFSYLEDLRDPTVGFNIEPEELKAEMWIPIPLALEQRIVLNEQMATAAKIAITELLEDSKYKSKIEEILDKVSEKELIAAMVAVARQESGGNFAPGNYSYHLWDESHNTFSLSPYHILMKGAGLDARHELELTEGQTYHPVNASKLFLAFLCEKTKRPEKFFPINEHMDAFKKFYNGSNVEEENPLWDDNVLGSYEKLLENLPE